MGVVGAKWSFAGNSAPPAIATLAGELAKVTGLNVTWRDASEQFTARIDVATIDQSLLLIDREADSLMLHGFVPAHPYLWENVDRVLTQLGGVREVGEIFWQPEERFHHLRRAWAELSRRQQFLLSLPTVGAWRWLDRWA